MNIVSPSLLREVTQSRPTRQAGPKRNLFERRFPGAANRFAGRKPVWCFQSPPRSAGLGKQQCGFARGRSVPGGRHPRVRGAGWCSGWFRKQGAVAKPQYIENKGHKLLDSQ
jgi:hypothetical protein